MNFEEMIASLTPKRDKVTINGFDFYARPMTVQEFGEFYYMGKTDKDRNDLMILNCIEKEDGTPVFENLEQISKLYTTVRAKLASHVSNVSILMEKADETEKQ